MTRVTGSLNETILLAAVQNLPTWHLKTCGDYLVLKAEKVMNEQVLGIVLLAHGAKDPVWREPFDKILMIMRDQIGELVSLSFLDHMEPRLLKACQDVIEAGATEVVVVPLFLGSGGHVRKDVPQLVIEAAREIGVSIKTTEAIGSQQAILSAIADSSLKLAFEVKN